METKVLLAIIAGVFSLLVALISLASSIISNRSTIRTTKALEQLKHSLAYQTRATEIADNELLSTLDVLMAAMQAIQKTKDETLLILNAFSDSLFVKDALSLIQDARKGLFAAYEKDHGRLSPTEQLSFHAAKNTALNIENALIADLKSKEYASQMSKETELKLSELRNRLTECQQLLRDSRTDRILKRTLGV